MPVGPGRMAAIARAGGPAACTQRPDVIDRAIKLMVQQDPEYHASLWDMVAALDLEHQLDAVTCPTMVVAGGEDPSAPAAAGQRIVDRITGSTLHVVEGCGHFAPLEAPEAFNELLRRFIEAS